MNGNAHNFPNRLLSSAAPPPPIQEVQWHTAHCNAHGTTDIITTRLLTGMTPGQSVVAFYGDAALANEYLGKGVYVDYIPLNTPQGQQLLQTHPLYAPNNHPVTAQAFVRVEHFSEAQPAEDLTSLNGIIEASGLPLTLANIPDGPARAQVYYRHPSNGGSSS